LPEITTETQRTQRLYREAVQNRYYPSHSMIDNGS
jgi:hypothetical protein